MKICTHYGFGDYVICYGLIKELSKSDNITLFVRPHQSKLHIDNIIRLYASIENVHINTNDPKLYSDVIYLGWDELFKAVEAGYEKTATEYFYDQAGVPLNLLWDNFYFGRDIEKEKLIYSSLIKENEEYIFIHDDPTRGFAIRNIPTDLKIIRLMDLADVSILDCLYLVEKAREVHVSNTGLVSFIDQMGITHDNLNYHRYVRPLAFEQPILKLKWNIYE